MEDDGKHMGSSAALKTDTPSGLSEAGFVRLRELIAQHSGLHFPPEKKYLLSQRLQQRLQQLKMAHYDDYVAHLSRLPVDDSEWAAVLNLVTTRETYFFREISQLEFMVRDLLPELLKRPHAGQTLRVLSAACSSGEEAYTLGVFLQEYGRLPMGLRWEVVGVDISSQALEQAEQAVYRDYAVRHMPEAIRKKYFESVGSEGAIRPQAGLRQKTRFAQANLVDVAQIQALGKFDLVFCRNVLIYFDMDRREQILGNLARVMHPGGFMITGFSESLLENVPGLQVKRFGNSPVYRRAEG